MPFRHHLDVEQAGVARGRADGIRQIELISRAFAREAAQLAQRELDVARSEFDRVIEIFEIATFPDFGRASLTSFLLADAHAFGIVAMGTER